MSKIHVWKNFVWDWLVPSKTRNVCGNEYVIDYKLLAMIS